MRRLYSRLRHKFFQMRPHYVNRFNSIVYEKYLPAAPQLTSDRLRYDRVVVFDHISLHRKPIRRRRFDHAHIPRAHQRHVQRPRDRRRAQRQHVHARRQFFDLLLLLDAEPLFLVDNQ